VRDVVVALVGSALRTARAERVELVAELDDVTADRDLPPTAPPTQTTDRSTMPGAPLLRLVDCADATPEDSHAGIEAALEASGLLDAWLGPRDDIAGHDVFADPSALAAVSGRSLAEVLVPEQSADIASDVVRLLLAAVALGDRLPADGSAAIGTDGTWRMGTSPVAGTRTRPPTSARPPVSAAGNGERGNQAGWAAGRPRRETDNGRGTPRCGSHSARHCGTTVSPSRHR
jgi:hypothetical protein